MSATSGIKYFKMGTTYLSVNYKTGEFYESHRSEYNTKVLCGVNVAFTDAIDSHTEKEEITAQEFQKQFAKAVHHLSNNTPYY